jgi:hypothetical protein
VLRSMIDRKGQSRASVRYLEHKHPVRNNGCLAGATPPKRSSSHRYRLWQPWSTRNHLAAAVEKPTGEFSTD